MSEKKKSPKVYKIRSRGWCFTVNNYTDDDIGHVSGLFYALDARYVIMAFEVGEQGTPHIQGYAYWPNKIIGKSVCYQVPRGHFAPSNGTKIEALTYCMKDLKYIEYGDRPRQGKRSDLDVIKYELLKGVGTKQISLDYFNQWCQYRRSFDEFVQMHKDKTPTLIIYNDECWEAVKEVRSMKDCYHPDGELMCLSTIYKLLVIHGTVAVPWSPWTDKHLEDWNEKFKVIELFK